MYDFLYYLPEPVKPEEIRLVQGIADRLQLHCRRILTQEITARVSELFKVRPENEHALPAFSDPKAKVPTPVLLLNLPDDEQLQAVLDAFREAYGAGLSRFHLKCVLTENNSQWSLAFLYEELYAEHRYFERMNTLRALYRKGYELLQERGFDPEKPDPALYHLVVAMGSAKEALDSEELLMNEEDALERIQNLRGELERLA